jgi:pimeloyl-ACP methyl ester carboxylesterase
MASAVAHWLEARDLRNVVLLGHSTGALVVLRAALAIQDRLSGVVLAGPSFPPDVRRAPTLWWRFFTTIPREPADEIESIAPSFLSSGGPGLFRLLNDGMGQRPEDHVGRLDVPVLVITGEHDGLAPPSWAHQLSQLARTGSLVVLPGAHNACFPNADAADAALRAVVHGWA